MPVGPTELIIIFLIVILLFGGRKIPEIAKGLGKGIRDFKASLEGKSEVEEGKVVSDTKSSPEIGKKDRA